MARLGFALASVSSLGFLIWLLVWELNSPGLSFAAALIAMPLLISLFGLFKVKGQAIAKDGKMAGWIAVALAFLGAGYLVVFGGSWWSVAIAWFALHVPLIVGILSSPSTEN